MPSTTSELLHKSIQKLENVKGICGNEDGAKHKQNIISPPPREPPSQARRCGKGKQGPGGFFSRSPESRRTAVICISEFILSLGARGLLWANCGTRCILGWLAELLPSRKSCVAWLLAAARPPQQATQPPQAFTAPLQASFSSQPVKLGH